MSNYPTDEPVYPATPIYDEAVVTTSAPVPGSTVGSTGSDSKASQAADQAKQTASEAKETVKGTAQDVKDQASDVAATAKDAGQQVASTTKDQAGKVVNDTMTQARQLYGQATDELSNQASKQQDRLTQGIRTFGQDLSKMGSGQKVDSGPASELMQNLSERAQRVANWLESRSPEEVLGEVRQFAARRPGLFIAIAAATGVVAARLTKALVAESHSDQGTNRAVSTYQGTSYTGDSTYVVGVGDTYVTPEPLGGYGTAGTEYGGAAATGYGATPTGYDAVGAEYPATGVTGTEYETTEYGTTETDLGTTEYGSGNAGTR